MIKIVELYTGLYKLVKPRCQTNRGNQNFFCRVAEIWNILKDQVVTSSAANEVKSKPNDHWQSHAGKVRVLM